MRRRLVLGAVAVVASALVLFAVPLGVLLRQQIVRSELDGFAVAVEQTATLVDDRSRTCGEVQALLDSIVPEWVDVVVFDRQGDARYASPGARAADRLDGVPDVLATAADGATGATLSEGQLVVAVPLSTPRCGELLIMQARADGSDLHDQVRRALLLLAGGAVVAVAAGAAAASALGAGLARPLERLAASARRLGEGDFSERAPRAGLPEPDGIADALDVTADRLGRAVTRGSAFAADASHQLRTPLTALRLQLEAVGTGLERDDPRRESLDGALAEVDRLTTTLQELVALTQLEEAEEAVDVAALVAARVPDWTRRSAEEGRAVELVVAPVPLVRVRPAAIAQATEVLVDNALRHGRGTVTVDVRPVAGGTDEALRITVSDQGPGLPETLDPEAGRRDRGGLPVHGGRGLVLARDLVEGEGGRLALRSTADGTEARLFVLVGRPRGGEAGGQAS